MEKPNYYSYIPAHIRYADITPNAKLLFAEITALLQMNGVCFASNKYFSKLYGKKFSDPNKFIFHNEIHPTTYTHKLMANFVTTKASLFK